VHVSGTSKFTIEEVVDDDAEDLSPLVKSEKFAPRLVVRGVPVKRYL
jgi:hypothetical protein